jgi:2-(1,2-epoxy-1,2-dihydrophenyl)acetyl-CoA isomerase
MTTPAEGSSDHELLARVENQVLWLTVNRPDAGNALTPPVRTRLIQHVREASTNADVRAILLTAVGDKHFCTGADLRVGGAPPPPKPPGAPEQIVGDTARSIRVGIQQLVATMLDCEKPIVTALNGTAAGMGSAMVLASDLVVAAEHARIIQVFVRRGLIPDGGGTYLLPRLVGLQRAKELIFLGDDLLAADALRMGLVNRVVPASELEATARALAERLARGPTKTIGFAKRLLNRSFDVDRATLFEDEALLVELVSGTADSVEGLAAFLERRSPLFEGY